MNKQQAEKLLDEEYAKQMKAAGYSSSAGGPPLFAVGHRHIKSTAVAVILAIANRK